MKLRLLFAAVLATGLFACNDTKKEGSGHVHSQDSVTHSNPENQGQLVLNDGKKWKLDEATRNNFDSIRKTVQIAATNEQKDYAKIATGLENDANRLVGQCRMSGKDHDMLHLWLENFLSDLKQLKSSSKDEQPMAFERIETLVKKFGDYFE
jgi:hypothetical protein